jgi:hypothetical protein
MRQEKIESYWSQFVEEFVGLRFDQFWEKRMWFRVPPKKTMIMGVYFDRKEDRYVGSIVTQPAAGQVVDVHIRMPYFANRWWEGEPEHWEEWERFAQSASNLITAPSNGIARERYATRDPVGTA